MSHNEVAMSRNQIGGEVPMVASELTEECIYTGLFGSIDSARMNAITERLTELAENRESTVAIIDLANVEAIDSSVASYMIRLANTLRLVGVVPIFCGISTPLAATMVAAGVDLAQYLTTRNLKSALRVALEISGYTLTHNSDDSLDKRLAQRATN